MKEILLTKKRWYSLCYYISMRQGNPIFLLFGLWNLVLNLHVWVKIKFFQT